MLKIPTKNQRGEVLIAIINNHADFIIANDQHWYRIPVHSAEKWLKNCWPPKWIAFYQTKIFGQEAYSINYYAKVVDVVLMYRWQLFPNLPRDKKSEQRYYQLIIEPLQQLSKPILSRRWRRIVFISTTWHKFIHAIEINDLFDDSPLEDRLWAEFKQLQIQAERQEFVKINRQNYALDFAIYCVKGKIDTETDGDTWHANPKDAAKDNLRDNALESVGWNVLRFTTVQIQEKMAEYCIPVVTDTINQLGGIEEGKVLPRKIDLNAKSSLQMGLFD